MFCGKPMIWSPARYFSVHCRVSQSAPVPDGLVSSWWASNYRSTYTLWYFIVWPSRLCLFLCDQTNSAQWILSLIYFSMSLYILPSANSPIPLGGVINQEARWLRGVHGGQPSTFHIWEKYIDSLLTRWRASGTLLLRPNPPSSCVELMPQPMSSIRTGVGEG